MQGFRAILFVLLACSVSSFSLRPGMRSKLAVPAAHAVIERAALPLGQTYPAAPVRARPGALQAKPDGVDSAADEKSVPQWVYALGALAVLSLPHFLYHAN